MTRTLLYRLIVATTMVAAIGVFWLCILTAGTRWSLLIAIPAVALAWVLDLPGRKHSW